MKVKVFKFLVSNPASSMLAGDEKNASFRECMSQLKKPEDIENVINAFCCDKDVIGINVNEIDVKYHNNGRGNTIELWYTIIYRQ